MSESDRPRGWVEMHTMGRSGRVGQTVRLAKAPEAKEVISWPQRPEYRDKLVRVKVLVSEAGIFHSFDAGTVVDLPESEARPRLKDGRVRLARPDEHPAGE